MLKKPKSWPFQYLIGGEMWKHKEPQWSYLVLALAAELPYVFAIGLASACIGATSHNGATLCQNFAMKLPCACIAATLPEGTTLFFFRWNYPVLVVELPCARACDGALATWVLTHSGLQQSAAVHLNQHFWDVALPAFYVIGVFFKLFQPGISGALVKGRKAGDRKFKQRNKRTMGRHKVWAICTHRLVGARCAS